ncbi:hypothetical protein GN958_ATG23139 [Phytophthora infestans]|uniref:Glycoside hydrolase n=1 Tax=Phytophthora infestans TaxID=4787 RepID=A0A8S9TII8_PHYIN|nr:hypothetical protein GN958_ATG23139 [Phytophthora infestans]
MERNIEAVNDPTNAGFAAKTQQYNGRCRQLDPQHQVPESSLISTAEDRAISTKNYMSLLTSVLACRQIGVLLSLHTLTTTDNGGLWYSESITQTEDICSKTFWNVIGLDLKNERYKGTWMNCKSSDFREGAQTLETGCLRAVETGRSSLRESTLLTSCQLMKPSTLSTIGIAVACRRLTSIRHICTVADNGALDEYVDQSNSMLANHISATMDNVFGFIVDNTSAALLLGAFCGLYATDLHFELTTKRCTDYSIDIIVENGWAGGFVWSLNPESTYTYNPADTYGTFTEDIIKDDLLTANSEFPGGG